MSNAHISRAFGNVRVETPLHLRLGHKGNLEGRRDESRRRGQERKSALRAVSNATNLEGRRHRLPHLQPPAQIAEFANKRIRTGGWRAVSGESLVESVRATSSGLAKNGNWGRPFRSRMRNRLARSRVPRREKCELR